MSHPDEDPTAWIGRTAVVPWLSRINPRTRPQEHAVTPPPPVEPPADGTLDTVHIFPDNGGEFRFHRKAANGRIISSSGEGFTRAADAVRAARRTYPDDGYRIVRADTGAVLFEPNQESSG